MSAGHVRITYTCASVHICAFVLAHAGVCLCGVCLSFLLRIKGGQRWDLPAALRPLPAPRTPSEVRFLPSTPAFPESHPAVLGRQDTPAGLTCFPAPFPSPQRVRPRLVAVGPHFLLYCPSQADTQGAGPGAEVLCVISGGLFSSGGITFCKLSFDFF